MRRARAKDLLLGAVGMLIVLAAVVAIAWWAVTDPVEDGEARRVPPSGMDGWRPPGVEPPDDLRDGEVWFAQLNLDGATMATEDSVLRDVVAIGQDVVTRPDAVVAARVIVEATVPFEAVAAELGAGAEVGPAADGQAMVVRPVELLDRELSVIATGTVEVEDGMLVVEPRSIDLGGPEFLSEAVADLVRRLVTIEYEIEGLPEGLVLQDVTVQDDGFRANLTGEDVRLVP